MTDNIDLLAGKLIELSDKLAEPAAAAALQAARIEAFSSLVGGILLLCATVLLLIIGHKLWLRGKEKYADETWFFGAVMLFLCAIGCAITGIWQIADPWVWAAINHPELWLAKKMLGL